MGKKILAMLLAGLMVLETGTMQVAATENQPVFEHSSTEESEENLEPGEAEENASEENLEPGEAEENAGEEVLEPGEAEENASVEGLEPQRAGENANKEVLEPGEAEIGEEEKEIQTSEPIDQAAVSPGEGLESKIKPGKVWDEFDWDYHKFGDQEEESLRYKSYDVYVVDVEQKQKISFSAKFTFDRGAFGQKETTVEAAIYRLQRIENEYYEEKYKVEKKIWKAQVRVGKEVVLLEEEITLPKGYYGIVIENMKNETYLNYSFETTELSLGESQIHIGDFWDKDDFGFGYYDYFIGDKVKSELRDKDFEAYVVKFSREKKISLSLNFALTKLPSRLKNATINVAVYRLYEDEDEDDDEGYYYSVEKKLWEKRIEVPKEGGILEEEITLLKGCYGIVIENLQGSTNVSYNFSTKNISVYANKISIPKELFLEWDEKKVIPVTNIKPEGAVKGINWSSSNKKVATVDSAGKVTAQWGGTCKITATLMNGTEYSCKVYVEDLTLSKIELRIAKGEKYTLQALYAYHPVTWESKNPKIAKVDKNGTVTGKKKGTTYIWAYMGKQKVKCKVIVEEPKLSKKTLKIGKGGSTELSLKGTRRKPKWSTSSKKIVTVKNGKITAKKKGKAKITASIGKIKYTCRITVGECPLKSTSLKVAVKGRRSIETRKKEKKIKWSSSAPKIASIKNGVVVGKKKGQAVVKAKIGDVTYNCKVKVENPKINSRSITLEHNRSYTLKMKNTTMKAKWSSSNSSIATVNAAGKVSGRSRGSAVITANIGGKKITCKVRVRGEVPAFSMNIKSDSDYYYIAGTFRVTNEDSKPMRICKENLALYNGRYSSFNRSLTMVSFAEAEQSRITPIPYVDIAPGQTEIIAFIVNGSPTYYVPSSMYLFEMIYDGERYLVTVSLESDIKLYRY